MLDINFIRENPEVVKRAAEDKNVKVDVDELLEVDIERRELQAQVDDLSRQRNELAGQARGKPSEERINEGKRLKEELGDWEEKLQAAKSRFETLMKIVPNIPSDDTPVGKDEAGNKILRTVGDKPEFSFTPKAHWELGEALGLIDSETAGAVSGSRFAYLKGELVWLQLALMKLAFGVLGSEEKLKQIASEAGLKVTSKPFMPVLPPVMIKPEILDKMGRLEPKEDRYHAERDNLYLVGSAEHTLGPMHMGENLNEKDLPLRYIGFSTAFRREAGSHGQDVRGILRMHQFDKIEIESFGRPEDAKVEQDFIVAIQEYLTRALKLPYQVVLKCTGDMGTPNARAIDIETWMPGQDKYRETHTSDLMTDYQARRLGTKIKMGTGESQFAHMNDATVFAMGRTLIAIMENYQQADGSIDVPEALRGEVPFKRIEPA